MFNYAAMFGSYKPSKTLGGSTFLDNDTSTTLFAGKSRYLLQLYL